jgi:hypothetical protein
MGTLLPFDVAPPTEKIRSTCHQKGSPAARSTTGPTFERESISANALPDKNVYFPFKIHKIAGVEFPVLKNG